MRNLFRCLGLLLPALFAMAGEVSADLCPHQYDAIFVGRVTKIARVGEPTVAEQGALMLGKPGFRARVWFAIERSYRGIDARRRVISVETWVGVVEAGAVYNFKVGERYLVYADGQYRMKRLDYSTLVVDSPGPSKPAAEAGQEMSQLAAVDRFSNGQPYYPATGASFSLPWASGRAISKPTPQYPPAAKAARLAGLIYVELTVGETGEVEKAKALCGPPLLAEAALKAAQQARFSPVRMWGRPTKFTTVVTYNFVLQ
jgi:TonB family protein